MFQAGGIKVLQDSLAPTMQGKPPKRRSPERFSNGFSLLKDHLYCLAGT